MKERNKNVRSSFGRYLQRKRLAERISLADVSKKTRIRIETLLAIEKEEHHKLPADTYVKGLLRGFAKAVGADAGKAVRRYEQNRKEINVTAQFEAQLKKSGAGSWVKLIYALGLFFTLVAISIYLMTWIGDGVSTETVFPDKEGKAATNRSKYESRPATTEKSSGDGSGDSLETLTSIANNSIREEHINIAPPGEDKKRLDTKAKETRPAGATGYLLSIHVVSDTWLKVIADDQESVKYQLKTGDRLDLTAFTRFNILIGNARGVRLFVNDRPLPVSGKSGQIVNIDIP